MANLQEYIYENVLMESLSMNKLSNRLGKIALQTYNATLKMEDGGEDENVDEFLDAMKRMRVEMLMVEKKYYNHDIIQPKLLTYFKSYIKGLNKIYKKFSVSDDKRIKRISEKIYQLMVDMKKLCNIMC